MDPTVQEWVDWHKEREEALQEAYGWLSLVELAWIGSDPRELEHFPGLWSASGDIVTFEAPSQGLFRDNEAVSGSIVLNLGAGADTSLTDTLGRQAEVASRFGKVMVRIRDPHAQTRRDFQGVPTYDYSAAWCVNVPWSAYPEPEQILVSSAQEGYQSELNAFGTVTLDGKDLIVTGADAPSTLIFHDETNGVTTEAWRAAPVTVEGEQATIDFNRSVNFPAHFTEYGTCPTPPAGNDVPQAVEAGEKQIP